MKKSKASLDKACGKLLLLLFSCLMTFSLTAQDVGLRPVEITKLMQLLFPPSRDTSLLRLYAVYSILADQSLTVDPHPIDTIRTEGLLQGDPIDDTTWTR